MTVFQTKPGLEYINTRTVLLKVLGKYNY